MKLPRFLLPLSLVCALSSTAFAASPPEDPAALDKQANELEAAGKFAEALPLARRALAIREKKPGPQHPDTAASLYTLAGLLEDTGDLAGAVADYRRCLAIRERALGAENVEVGQTLHAMGTTFIRLGNLTEAEAVCRRALAIREKTFGADSFEVAKTLNNLAGIYQTRGDGATASDLYARALRAFEKKFGPDHPVTAYVLANLGALELDLLGDYARAEDFCRRSLEIREKALGPEHPLTALSLQNLASARYRRGDLPGATALNRRALAIFEKGNGPDHPLTCNTRNNLATCLSDAGELDEAERLDRENLAARERALGPRHPETASALVNLGLLRRKRGDPAAAEALFARADDIYAERFGPAHPKTVASLVAHAGALLDLRRTAEAAAMAVRAARASEQVAAGVFGFTSGAQRLEFQASRDVDPVSLLATLGAAAPLAETVLRTKGAVLDSLLEDALLARASADPARRAQLDEGRALRRELTEKQMAPPAADAPEPERKRHAADVAALGAKLEKLEGAMARQVAGLGRARRTLGVTVETLRPAIPDDSVLVEFLRYQHELGAGKTEPRYGALVLRPGGGGEDFTGESVRWVPLGPAEEVEKELRAAGGAVRGKGDALALEEALTAVYQKVWAPVAAVLPPKAARVFLSPDGELHSLSFAALPAPGETFLAAQHRFTYLSSGRELMFYRDEQLPKTNWKTDPRRLLVFANPQLALAPVPATPNPGSLAVNEVGRETFRDLRLGPLPGAAAEGAALVANVKTWFGGPWRGELVTGADASEARLFGLGKPAPRILHLATHGFFLPAPSAEHGNAAALANPMRRSGLALAGAADTLAAWARGEPGPRPAGDDGIVTAEEVAGLDLRGCELVTVSACDSGGGEARAGEGVLGLRRGFALAGARNLLLTLWPVEDRETAALMADFYAAVGQSGDPARALAEVQRDHLARLRREGGFAAAVRGAGAFILSAQR